MLTKPLPSLSPAQTPDKQARLRGLCPSSRGFPVEGTAGGVAWLAAGWVGRVGAAGGIWRKRKEDVERRHRGQRGERGSRPGKTAF